MPKVSNLELPLFLSSDLPMVVASNKFKIINDSVSKQTRHTPLELLFNLSIQDSRTNEEFSRHPGYWKHPVWNNQQVQGKRGLNLTVPNPLLDFSRTLLSGTLLSNQKFKLFGLLSAPLSSIGEMCIYRDRSDSLTTLVRRILQD